MGSIAEADYFAERAAEHDALAERTASFEARRAHRELSVAYAAQAAALTGPIQQLTCA